MSGIYIPNMEMPTTCFDCPLCEQTDFYASPYCRVSDDDDMMSINEIRSKRRDNCPLIPVRGDLYEEYTCKDGQWVPHVSKEADA